MTIRAFAFTLDAADYLAANRLHLWATWRRYGFAKLFAWLFVPYCLLFFGLFGAWTWRSVALVITISAVTAAAVAAILIFIGFALLPRRTRRLFAQQRSLHGRIDVSWDDDAITLATADASSRHRWADFAKWSEDRQTLLLYQSDAMFNMLPRRCLSPEQVADIRDRLDHAKVAWFGRRPAP